MPGVISAPARTPVFLVWGAYVAITGARSHPRGRVWILADSADIDARMTCVIAWNDPVTGRATYEDLGELAQASVRPKKHSEFHMISGETIMTVEHPCVCGAGQVGNAAPAEGRITLTYVNPYNRPRLNLLT